MNLLFSIVIPTYNRADLILDTLQSVFDQTYKHYEVIVVDNCSTDSTEQLLQPFVRDSRIKYIRHDRNYERSRSRNTGMKAAKGDFLTFLDSDDFMYSSCLKDAADYARLNPNVRFFQNLYELVDNKRNKIYTYEFPSLDNQYKALASGNFIGCIGGFLHREIYTNIQFLEDPLLIGSEDYEVWFKIMARYKMGRINKVNCGIRQHPNRSVNLGVYDNLNYQKKLVVEKIKADPITFEKFKPYLNRLEASFNLQQAAVGYQLKNKKLSLRRLSTALKIDPSVLFTMRFIKILFNTLKS